MSEADDYRAALAACRRMAEKTSDMLEKNAWLDMAESWRLLLICCPCSTHDNFNDAAHGADLSVSRDLHEPLAGGESSRYLQAYQAIREAVDRSASCLRHLLKSY